ncbi:MAG: hypothetical protein ACP5O7_12260, partial [Phycisphaerae bacterium]
TNLGRAGVSIRTAMEVMRHSDPRLTTRTYTDGTLLPTAEAVESLPRWSMGIGGEESLATGTDDVALTPSARGTKKGSFRRTLVPYGAQCSSRVNSEKTRMNIAQSIDNKANSDMYNSQPPLGLEPRT